MSCDDRQSYTTSRTARLTFSSDTIQFDTVITTVGSSLQQLMVYNPNNDGLRLASARLKKGMATPFRVNVDGVYLERESGAVAYGFEVLGGDSLRVFAEVTVPENGQDAPVEILDTLIFTLESGIQQHVILQAAGQDAYMWHGKVLDADTMLQAGRPFVIYDSLTVAPGATLTLGAGVQLYFHDEANLWVRGRLLAEGTKEQPVVFRGDRTDRLLDYLPYDNTPSRWGGIRLFEGSTGNVFRYADIHSASYGILCDSTSTDHTLLTMENSVIHNIGGDGLALYHCRSQLTNTQVSNTLGHCVGVYGGWTEWLHCTIAQFYPWDALRGDALHLANVRMAADYPLQHAHFLNCVITGYADDVVMGNLTEEDGMPLDYYFGHCLLRTVEAEDTLRFEGVVYDLPADEGGRDKMFRLFDTDNFLYDFRLDSLAAARNIGSVEWADRCPSDYDGQNRLADEGPDAGCYEFAVQDE